MLLRGAWTVPAMPGGGFLAEEMGTHSAADMDSCVGLSN